MEKKARLIACVNINQFLLDETIQIDVEIFIKKEMKKKKIVYTRGRKIMSFREQDEGTVVKNDFTSLLAHFSGDECKYFSGNKDGAVSVTYEDPLYKDACWFKKTGILTRFLLQSFLSYEINFQKFFLGHVVKRTAVIISSTRKYGSMCVSFRWCNDLCMFFSFFIHFWWW